MLIKRQAIIIQKVSIYLLSFLKFEDQGIVRQSFLFFIFENQAYKSHSPLDFQTLLATILKLKPS